MSKFKIYFLLLAIGFVFITWDVNIETNFTYPNEYANTDSVIGEFQYYNIASNYNARCTYKFIDTSSDKENTQTDISKPSIDMQNSEAAQQGAKVIDKIYFENIKFDVVNDFVGFLIIFIACLGLRKCSKRFRGAATTSIIAMILYTIIFMLPFVTNGLILCNIAMTTGLAYLICNVTTTFLFANGLFTMCSDICCRDERKWCKILWYLTCVTHCLVTFVLWLGSDYKMLYNVGLFFEFILVALVIIFWIVLYKTYSYLENSYNNFTNKLC